MPTRILSISGLRGILGDGLDPVFVADFAAAVGTLAGGGTLVVSRDGRSTGPMMKHAVLAGLLGTGCRVLDTGIAATPTCGVLITALSARGGVQITASHNPPEYNGLKPFTDQGSVYDDAAGAALLEALESKVRAWKRWNGVGSVETIADPSQPHLDRLLPLVDVEAIRRARLSVVLDCCHGSGAILGPRLLEQLGCRVHVLGGVPDGNFTHPPEPLAENLTALCAEVRARGADAGFAQDPDADRLAIVDETGRYLGEEYTLALCVDEILPRRPGPVVVNGSTSRMNADLAAKYGCPFHRSFVGEAHVVARMRAVSAAIGGEGNGGLIEPRVGWVRDSFASMIHVLAGLATRGRPLSRWADSLPRYAIVKDKLPCGPEAVPEAVRALREAHPDAQASEGDGLRLDWPDRWLQIRASNTEPILRVIAEAPDAEAARALCDRGMAAVRNRGE